MKLKSNKSMAAARAALTPEIITRRNRSIRRTLRSASVRAKIGLVSKARHADPVIKARHREATRQGILRWWRVMPLAQHKAIMKAYSMGGSRAFLKKWKLMSSDDRRNHVKKALAASVGKNTANPSSLEKTVGLFLSANGIAHRVQVPIGPYFADFLVPHLRLVIECDGEYWHGLNAGSDSKRDRVMKRMGYKVLRLPGKHIKSGMFVSKLLRRISSIQGDAERVPVVVV